MMIDPHSSAALNVLTPLRVCAVLSLAVGLGLLGCDDKTDVRSTVPADGTVNVNAETKILVRFSSGFTAMDDTSPEKLGNGITVFGDKTADLYEGTVQVRTFQDALDSMNGNVNPSGDGPPTLSSLSSTEPGLPETSSEDTLIFSLAEGESFKTGETVTVQIHGNFEVRGNSVGAHMFTFVIVMPPPGSGELTDLRIVTTDPGAHSTSAGMQPRIGATFTEPVVPGSLDGNVIIQGQHSGAVVAPNVIQSKKDSNGNVLELAVRLVDDEAFTPGEWISVTFNRGIESSVEPVIDIGNILSDPTLLLDLGNTAATAAKLSPYNLRFQITPGAIGDTGAWITQGLVSAGNDILKVVSGDLRPEFVGVDFAILFKTSVGCFYEREPGSGTWEAIFLDFEAGQTPIDLAVLDFDLDGTPEILVLLEGETASEILYLQFNDIDELTGVLAPLKLPLTGLIGMEISDIDVNGGLDIIIHHKSQAVRFEEDSSADDGTGDDSGDGSGDDASMAAVDTRGLTVLGPGSLTVVSRTPTSDDPDLLRVEVLPILAEMKQVRTADLDSDGKPDLLFETSDGIHVYRNATGDDGVLTFQFARILRNTTGINVLEPLAWGVADLDGDRDVDIVAWDALGALVYENTVFVPPPVVDPDAPDDSDDGGGDGDGTDDGGMDDEGEPATSNDQVGLIFDDILPVEAPSMDLANGVATAHDPWFGDVNGDALLDVLLVDGQNAVALLTGQEGALTFGSGTVFSAVGNGDLLGFATGDFDGDTGLDVVLISHDEDSLLANDSLFQVYRTTGVTPVEVLPIASYRLAFCESDETPTEDDCVEDRQGVLADSLLEIPVLITASESYSGYTLLLDYDPEVLEFVRYDNSSRFQREPSVETCSGEDASSDCDSFVRVQVVSQQSARAQAPEAAGRGTDLSLGTFVFRPWTVSEPTPTDLVLLQTAEGRNDMTFETQVELVEGAERVSAVATAETTELTVVVKPPLLSDVACEIGDVRIDDYDVTVSWTISAEEANLVGEFEILDGGQSVIIVTDRFARQFTIPVEGTASHNITLVVRDLQGVELDRDDCDTVSVRVFRPRVTCDFRPTSGDRGTITITWSVLGSVSSYGVFKNGIEIRTLSSGQNTEFVDFNAHINDFYEIEARFAGTESPRGACPDQNPGETLPPDDLQLTLAERQTSSEDLVVEAAWNNREAYNQVHLELFLEPDNVTPFVSVDLGSGDSSYVFDDDRRGGMPPGRYRATIFGSSSGLASADVSSNTLDVTVPTLDADALTCDLIEGDVQFAWTAWQGYTALELKAVDRGSGAVLRSEFVDPTIASFVFEEVIIAQEADFTLRGEYSDFLPVGFDSESDTTCGADPVATFFVARAHTGLELRREIRIPLMADLPARLSGFVGTIEVPSFFEPDSTEGDPGVSLVLNHDVVTRSGGTTAQVTLSSGPVGRQQLAIDVSGVEVNAANGVTVGWIAGRIDWDTHGTEILGRYPLDIVVPFQMTFPTAGGSPLVLQSRVRDGDDPPAAAELVVNGRYFSIEEVPTPGGPSASPGDIVTLRVLLTQDDTQGPQGYQLEFLIIEASYDSDFLEALTLPSQSESVLGDGFNFPFISGPNEGSNLGTLGDFYFATPGSPTIGAGIDQTVMVAEFRVRSASMNGQDFTPIEFDFTNVLTPDEELTGDVSPDRSRLVPAVAYNTAPPDDLPSVAFFHGGVRLQARTDLPTIESVSPARGSLAGGNTITLRGANLDAGGDPGEGFPKVQFLDDGDVVLEVAANDVTVENPTSLTFSAPSAIAFDSSVPAAQTFDLRVLPRAGSESGVFEAAYTFEPLAVKSTNVVSVTTMGGQQMAISGTGFSPTTQVQIRVDGSTEYAVTDQDPVPADGRSLSFRVPPLPGEGGKLASIAVEVAGLGTVELPVPIKVEGESAVVARVLSVDPNTGLDTGGNAVQVNVSGFESLDNAQVFFAERAATDVIPDAQNAFLTVTVPAASAVGSVSVRVVAGGNDAIAANLYTYIEIVEPEILSVDPTNGAIEGGNTVTISFAGFDDATEFFGVSFGATTVDPADIVAIASTSLDVIVPMAAAAGPVDVTLSAGIGFEATLANGYEYVSARIVGIEPTVGPSGGGNPAILTVEDVFDLAPNPQVLVGGVEATVDNVLNNEGTATISLTMPAVCAVGTVDVAVISGNLTLTLPGAYTYNQSDLAIASVSPIAVSECGGDTVTVTGSGFCADMTLRVGGSLATGFTLVDSATLTFTTAAAPPGSQESVEVSIDGSNFVSWNETLSYEGQRFIRGDVDGSGVVDITDTQQLSEFIVGVKVDFPVFDALDVNDDGLINAGDLVQLTDHLFNGAVIPPPHPDPGFDPDDPFDPIGSCQ